MLQCFDLNDANFCNRLGRHLEYISSDILELETAISEMHLNVEVKHDAQVSIQKLDHVYQRIVDLASLFDAISKEYKSDITLLEKVSLAETRALLLPNPQETYPPSGELDLFD